MIHQAYRFIRYDKAKSIGVIIGIVISTFLIGQQLGIASFLTSLMSALVDNSSGDIWVVDSRTKDANALGALDVRKAREIKSIEGVAETYTMVLVGARATFTTGKSLPVTLIGSEAPAFAAGPPPDKFLAGNLRGLESEGAVSVDFYDAPVFDSPIDIGTAFEINGKRAVIAAHTNNLRGFGGSSLYTTLERARYFGNASNTDISAVIVKVKPGYSPQEVRDAINQSIFGVRAWVREDFSSSTVSYVLGTTGIGASTGTLVVFAVISGFFIIGLTMYSSALDRIKDYGTLKAIGASNGYIRRLILTQAGIFALVGFAIAYVLLEGFRNGVKSSGLVFELPPLLLGGIFAITLFISLFGAVFALVRIIRLEPAAVFRG